MQDFSVDRSGIPPLRFQGDLIAEADGFLVRGQEQTCWHEIQVYRTPGGNFVVAISLHSNWQGETGHSFAKVCESAAEASAVVQHHDPVEHLQGYPEGAHFAAKQTKLIESIRRRFAALATEVYGQLGAEFAEVVP